MSRSRGARTRHDAADPALLLRVLRERAALRRVAARVACGARPGEVFTAVADELGRLLGADAVFVSRVDRASGERDEPAGDSTVVGFAGRAEDEVPVGLRTRLYPGTATTAALRTGRPVRFSGAALAASPISALITKLGIRALVAAPISVGGRQWGVTVAATSREDFPAGTESRMAGFVELAAAAIANAQAEQDLCEMARAQASLRRLALLVAQDAPPDAVFAAVAKEVLRYFGDGTARMIRYELDGTATLVATAAADGDPPGGRAGPGEDLRPSVAMPIHVHGRLWGMIVVGSGRGPLPQDTVRRLTRFTDLVATAIANAQSRAELLSSRARLVAASDEARRRIERDLHDGAQQRLVALALRLRAAEGRTGGGLRAEIADVAAQLVEVVDDLREISRGIHPAILTESGLGPALRALGRRSAVPVDMTVRVGGRLPEPVEVGAYYVVSEVLANVAKHAGASVVEVDAEASGGVLRLRVRDDGVGGAEPAPGSGLAGLRDRTEALGGRFTVHSPAGRGTTVTCEFPVTTGPGLPDAGPGRYQDPAVDRPDR